MSQPGRDRSAAGDRQGCLYFSFTIAAACQTSDVATRNVALRRVVTAQTLVSFVFNVSIVGFAVNVSASLL